MPMVILSLSEKGGETKQLEFNKAEVVIGRVQGNDIVLPKGNVSKRHCRIVLHGNSFSVEDFNSTNGTYVNGRKISAITPIFQGDKVYIGDFVIRVENAPAPEAASLGDEAGSLSSALHNRRESANRAAVPDPDPVRGARKATVPPPPPPPAPPRREASAPLPPPTDLNLDDDEPLATAPPPAPSPPRGKVGIAAPPVAAPPAVAPPPAAPPRPSAGERPATDIPSRPVRGLGDSDLPSSNQAQVATAPSNISDPKNPAGWVTRLLGDPAVSTITIIGPRSVAIERGGLHEQVALGEAELQALTRTLTDLVRQGGGNPETGIVDVGLPGGARLVGLFAPVASQPCVTIRRAPSSPRRLHDLVDAGALSREMCDLLETCVACRRNLLVVGDAMAMQAVQEALAGALPSGMSVVGLGARVRPSVPRQAWVDLTLDGTQLDAIGMALAARPDTFIVDLRSPLVNAEVIRQLALGHQGTLATLPARSMADALTRLEATLTGVLGPSEAVRAQIAVAFEAVVYAATRPSGGVRIGEIGEPHLVDGALVARALFQHGEAGFRSTGKPSRLAGTLARLGKTIPGLVTGA